LYSRVPPELAVVDDAPALQLLPLKLALPLRVLTSLPFGARTLHRVIGAATRGLSYHVALRTAVIDDVVRAGAERGLTQLVSLGAGLDTRAWRMPELERVDVYELDYPSTQAYKRPRIEALAPVAKAVHFAAIDFERDDLRQRLAALGFDASAPTMWICEGVLPYLTRHAIDAMLDGVARSSAADSVVALSYVPPEYAGRMLRFAAERLARSVAEPIKTTLLPSELASSLTRRGFLLQSDDAAPEWAARYWPAPDARRARGWERLVLARKVESG
jgi:methyltransferase (TIGR00027 family)